MHDMVPNSGTSKDIGLKLPSTTVEWALFEVPQEVHDYYMYVILYKLYFLIMVQLVDRMKTESSNSNGRNSFIEKPVRYQLLSNHNMRVSFICRYCQCIILGYWQKICPRLNWRLLQFQCFICSL